jgi:16S rRNA (adenine1518-N6/adenine1519-N6)-dimethyltransferase
MKRSKRRRLGQNFLVDEDVAERIVSLLAEDPPQVMEIGPGRGALTGPLLERFAKVRAVELDEPLVAPLERQFGSRRLEVLHADALTASLDELAAGGRWQVASNLPYSVGTAILRRLMPRSDLFSRLVVMLQHEVALRVVHGPSQGISPGAQGDVGGSDPRTTTCAG